MAYRDDEDDEPDDTAARAYGARVLRAAREHPEEHAAVESTHERERQQVHEEEEGHVREARFRRLIEHLVIDADRVVALRGAFQFL